METKVLRIFVQVYQKKSFAKVAKDSNLAPSSITRAIIGLEKELGVRLFQRTTRAVIPTQQGEKYYQKIMPLIEELELANDELKNDTNHISGVLRITSPTSFGQIHLPNVCSKFNKLYPNIKFELLITDSIVDILSNQVDVGIRFGRLKNSSLISTKLCELKYIVCCSKSYLKNKTPVKTPQDLSQHDCITFMFQDFRTHWKFKKAGKIQNIEINPKTLVSNGLTQKEMALKGLGIVLLPEILIKKELTSGKLVNLFPSYELAAGDFNSAAWLIYPSRSYLPTKTRFFIDFIKEHFHEN